MQLESECSRRVRLLGCCVQQVVFAREKKQRVQVHELPVVELRKMNRGFRLAVEKLAEHVDPGKRIGRHQNLAINTVSPDSVCLRQIRQRQLLAEERRGSVAKVLIAGENI